MTLLPHGHPFAGLPRNHFRGILIDPPTKFVGGTKSRPQHYKRMTDHEIGALPVADLVHPDGCWIGLWVTSPKLYRPIGSKTRLRPDELAAMWTAKWSARGWVWIKVSRKFYEQQSFLPTDAKTMIRAMLRRGQGLTTGKNAEDVLLFKIGKPPVRTRKGFEPILAPARQHSRKPDEIYEQFELLSHGPYLELFARCDGQRKNWSYWGDQVDLFKSPSAVAA